MARVTAEMQIYSAGRAGRATRWELLWEVTRTCYISNECRVSTQFRARRSGSGKHAVAMATGEFRFESSGRVY